MYPQIITYLLTFINYQEQIIRTLLTLLIGKSMFDKPKEAPVNQPYRKLQIDDLPIIEKLERLDYQLLLAEHLQSKGKPLKPVQRRANSTPVPSTLCCPKCGAPSAYLYANNGGKGQYQCKVCSCVFNKKSRYQKEAILKCPHCLKPLEKIKERKDFHVFKCKNDMCTYYQKNLSAMTKKEKKQFKEDPQSLKVRYIYRKF
ncbi:transposase, partial [Halalkalibacterium halodurans]